MVVKICFSRERVLLKLGAVEITSMGEPSCSYSHRLPLARVVTAVLPASHSDTHWMSCKTDGSPHRRLQEVPFEACDVSNNNNSKKYLPRIKSSHPAKAGFPLEYWDLHVAEGCDTRGRA